jgi:putative FmdB family regulatory protein
MPTYTYRCTKCGTEIEVVQSMSDPPLKRCKKCRGALRRTYHPVGIVLKGSGFHRNDYRSPKAGGSSSEKKESSSSSESKSSDSKSSDSKSSGGTSSEKKTETKKPAAASGD